MITWRDEGFLLGLRAYGEKAKIACIFTQHKGLAWGLLSRSPLKHTLDIGVQVNISWTARLEHQMGRMALEPLPSPHVFLSFEWPGHLRDMLKICGLMQKVLPERHPYPKLWETFSACLKAMGSGAFSYQKVLYQWELLKSLGYGLELNQCVLTNQKEGLSHVSPKSGRAVCGAAAKDYLHRLLVLPPFLVAVDRGILPASGSPAPQAIADGQALTNFFIRKHLWEAWEADAGWSEGLQGKSSAARLQTSGAS